MLTGHACKERLLDVLSVSPSRAVGSARVWSDFCALEMGDSSGRLDPISDRDARALELRHTPGVAACNVRTSSCQQTALAAFFVETGHALLPSEWPSLVQAPSRPTAQG